jgi:hypothetical protein
MHMNKRMLALLVLVAAAATPFIGMNQPPAQATGTPPAIDPADFQASITNPLFPISLTGPRVFTGEDIDPDTGERITTRLESQVLAEQRTIMGVSVTVLEEKAFEDDQLVERALDFFAQHRNGDVYYFGEEVDNYEDGALKDHHGQWTAGDGDNRPGVLMPANPVRGVTYQQEFATGIAEDMAEVLETNAFISVPAGSFSGCVKTRDFTPLEPGVDEFKWYCPGAGIVRETGEGSVSELVTIGPAPQPATPNAPAPTSPAVTSTATPHGGIIAPRTGSGDDGGSTSIAEWIVIAAIASGMIATTVGVASRRRR